MTGNEVWERGGTGSGKVHELGFELRKPVAQWRCIPLLIQAGYLYRKRTLFQSQSSDYTVHNKFAFMNYTDRDDKNNNIAVYGCTMYHVH